MPRWGGLTLSAAAYAVALVTGSAPTIADRPMADAQWFFDNFGSGAPVVVKNSVGRYDQNDGAQDWQI
jgi:hypothetical protein